MSNTLLTGSARDAYIAERFQPTELEMASHNAEVSMQAQADYDVWYESKPLGYQLLIDSISERTDYITEEHEFDAFIEELANNGINDAVEFVDAFEQEVEGYGERIFADFAEELCKECWEEIQPSFIANCIDWERVWHSTLRFDYQTIEFKSNTYFFRNI